MTYRAQIYHDPDTGRSRQAVLHLPTRTWYFPKVYGVKAAKALAAKLNKAAGGSK